MWASFNRFELQMTRAQAESASHQGACDADVLALSRVPAIAKQIANIDPMALALELKESGAWDVDELSDNTQNRQRILWIAAGNIVDGQ